MSPRKLYDEILTLEIFFIVSFDFRQEIFVTASNETIDGIWIGNIGLRKKGERDSEKAGRQTPSPEFDELRTQPSQGRMNSERSRRGLESCQVWFARGFYCKLIRRDERGVDFVGENESRESLQSLGDCFQHAREFAQLSDCTLDKRLLKRWIFTHRVALVCRLPSHYETSALHGCGR